MIYYVHRIHLLSIQYAWHDYYHGETFGKDKHLNSNFSSFGLRRKFHHSPAYMSLSLRLHLSYA